MMEESGNINPGKIIKAPKVCKYISKQNCDRQYDASEVLDEVYNLETIKNRFVVGEENDGYFHYLVFDSIGHYQEYIQNIPMHARNYHEIIFGILPQKLKIDIDIKVKIDIDANAKADVDAKTSTNAKTNDKANNITPENVQQFLREVDETIIYLFDLLYGTKITQKNIITTDSSGQEGGVYKHSYHKIIDNYCVANYEESAYFTDKLKKICGHVLTEYIDDQVNKKTQNFRLLNCCKRGSARYKHILGDDIPFERTVIGCTYYCKKLPNKVTVDGLTAGNIDVCGDITEFFETEDCEEAVAEEDVKDILNIAREHTRGFAYRNTLTNGPRRLINFNRVEPSYCDLCAETHHRDNTLMISANVKNGICYLRKLCRHAKSKSIFIGSFRCDDAQDQPADNNAPANQTNAEEYKNELLQKFIDESTGVNNYDMFLKLPIGNKNIYSDPLIRDFEFCDTLCIKANTGMGKTRKLVEYIEKHFKDTKEFGYKIMFISFRQTFSSNIKEKFPNYIVYSDVAGNLSQDKLIVQVESLHRVQITPGMRDVDLLILDESESILSQFSSGLGRCFNKSWPVFEYLINNAKKVICMDANLSDRTYNTLMRMRVNTQNKYGEVRSITFHCNTYKNRVDDTFQFTYNKINWYSKLYSDIEDKLCIALCTNSLEEAKILGKNIAKRYPEARIGIYTGDTPQAVKKEHFNNINEFWAEYDVLIYTPTVTAGVSFEQKHYDKVYGLFTDLSCDVETCIQMLHRVRDVSQNEYNICLITQPGGYYPTSVEKIKEMLYTNRENLYKDYDDSLLTFTYDINGAVKYYESNYFSLWLENARIKNMSRNAFAKLLVGYLKDSGACLELFDHTAENPALIKQENTVTKSEIKHEQCEKIANARDLDIESVQELKEKFGDQTADISDDEKNDYERFKLRRDYCWAGPIDESFVEVYSRENIKRQFKNVKKLLTCSETGDVNDSLKIIQQEELHHYKRIMDSEIYYQDQDVQRKYIFDHHRVAIALLKLCGWNTIVDSRTICEKDLFNNIHANNREIYDLVTKYFHYYSEKHSRIKHPNIRLFRYDERNSEKNYISGILPYINRAIKYMYGVGIIADRSMKFIYKLSTINKFYTMRNAPRADKPNIFDPEWTPRADVGYVPDAIRDNNREKLRVVDDSADSDGESADARMNDLLNNLK